MNEAVRYKLDSLRQWHRKTAGLTVFGSYLGTLVLTDRRLLFLSTGSGQTPARLAASLAAGPIGVIVVGKVITVNQIMDDLNKEGSFQIPLERIKTCQAKRRWDFGAYLQVGYSDEDCSDKWTSFMTEFGLAKSTIDKLQTQIEAAMLTDGA